MIQRYISKISGPLMDRIDIHIDVPAVNYKEMRSTIEPESSAKIRGACRARSPEATGALFDLTPEALLQRPDVLASHPELL